MKLYYIVDKLQTVRDHYQLLKEYRARAIADHKDDTFAAADEEVYVCAYFRDEGAIAEWEAVPGVTSLGDPFDDTPMADAHMEKLAKALDLTVETNSGKKQFRDKTGAVLPQNHHVRKAMAYIANTRDPGFRFRLF